MPSTMRHAPGGRSTSTFSLPHAGSARAVGACTSTFGTSPASETRRPKLHLASIPAAMAASSRGGATDQIEQRNRLICTGLAFGLWPEQFAVAFALDFRRGLPGVATGHTPLGVSLVDYAPHGHWKTITFVAGLRQHGMTALSYLMVEWADFSCLCRSMPCSHTQARRYRCHGQSAGAQSGRRPGAKRTRMAPKANRTSMDLTRRQR